MSKLRFLLVFCTMTAITLSTASAGLIAMTETEMHHVTAQAGVFIDVDKVRFDSEMKTLSYGSDATGWISLNDVRISTFVNSGKPIEVGMVTEYNPYEGRTMEMMKIDFTDVEIRMDELLIGSIRVGPRPGEGPSFGSIGITGFHANMSGNVRIWTR
ncbi:DUF6160 family protein [Desulfobotulus sp.]|jgi:hypothetical protein|uniref:DUF6160 family protein n=1 Tax=Desulfobotulus sp. TaxID=1940337 RepID=UPI002A35DFCF|nr:DUF6160 family protein [Desulfobotulus sp.]MDY0161866.1 hypothetical protein [Desulfobotulus sp.]